LHKILTILMKVFLCFPQSTRASVR
jgi:hypothetical protein